MDQLFTKEIIEQVLNLLKQVADGSVFAIVLYLCIPIIMLLITAIAYSTFGIYTVKAIKAMVLAKFNQEVVKMNTFKINDRFITHRGEHSEFFDVLESLKSDTYIHKSDIDWLKIAIQNQKGLDNIQGTDKYRPAKLSKFVINKKNSKVDV